MNVRTMIVFGMVALCLLVVDCAVYVAVRNRYPVNTSSKATYFGEFQCFEEGKCLVVRRGIVKTGEGKVFCGTNSLPLVAGLPYVYICGENDVTVLRYSER